MAGKYERFTNRLLAAPAGAFLVSWWKSGTLAKLEAPLADSIMDATMALDDPITRVPFTSAATATSSGELTTLAQLAQTGTVGNMMKGAGSVARPDVE